MVKKVSNIDKEIILSNVPSVTVGKLVEVLSKSYSRLIKENKPLKNLPSVMLWGAPGVGKSEGVRQIADEISEITGKKTNVTDVRLLLFNPIDLRGIPTSNEDKSLAIWLKPKIFQMDESEDVVNILFLDEITAAPQSVQAAAYQITLDRTIGEHKLPDNCIVIAAGNRVTDKSVVSKMPKALANRLMHFEIEIDFDSWEKWAVDTGINPLVIGYLRFNRSALFDFDSSSEDKAFATPRSWKMVSDVLDVFDDDMGSAFTMISGLVGMAAAYEFKQWYKEHRELPNMIDIFKGKCNYVPESPGTLYILASEMVVYAKLYKDDLNKIANSIRYAMLMPVDYSVMLIRQYMNIEKGYIDKLMKIPEFYELEQRQRRSVS